MASTYRMKIFCLCRGFCRTVGPGFSNSRLGLSRSHIWLRHISANSTPPPPFFNTYKQNYKPRSPLQCRSISEDKETSTVTLWTNLKEVKSSPVPALVLGLAGLIPFVSAPTYMTASMLYMPHVAFAQVAYGAVVLSFLGGIRWGFVLPAESRHHPNWFNLGYSVTPALVAWVGTLLPDPLSVVTVMAGLAGAAYFDTVVPGYPPWFKGLRFLLSFVAILSLWTTFMCGFFLEAKKDSDVSQL